MNEQTVQRLAQRVMSNSRLRSRVLRGEPNDAVAEVVKPKGFRARIKIDAETEDVRKRVLDAINDRITRDAEASSSVHADAVMRQFFAESIRNPEVAFRIKMTLSVLTFAVGIGLVGVGVWLAAYGNDALLASLFGGGGLLGALFSTYNAASEGVRTANANHARIRLVLTGFATELGHLRAYSLKELDEIERVNVRIREAMLSAVEAISEHVKADGVAEAVKPLTTQEKPEHEPAAR